MTTIDELFAKYGRTTIDLMTNLPVAESRKLKRQKQLEESLSAEEQNQKEIERLKAYIDEIKNIPYNKGW